MNEIFSSGTDLILHITTIIMVFISFLFSFFLLTIKSKNKLGNQLLSAYIIIRALDASVFIYKYYIDLPPVLEVLRHDIGTFFQKPLLYLFVLSIIYSDFRLRKHHLLHLIPFVLGLIVMFPRFYLPEILGEEPTFTKEIEINTIYWLAAFQQIGYLIATFWLLFRYRKIQLENYSYDGKTNYRWLLHMNIFMVTLFVFSSYKNVYKLMNWGEYGYVGELRVFVLITMLIFTCWLVLKALYAPKIFTGIDSSLQLSFDGEQELNPDLPSKIELIKTYLAKEEPFLNPDLTIKELAESLSMDSSELSLIINKKLNQNFYEFISGYRIEKAMEIFSDPAQKKLSVLEVLYQVGYNSKSSFNTSFKAKTGLTPTAYRNKMLVTAA